MKLHTLFAPWLALLTLAGSAAAQGFNVDVGQNLILWPTPDASFGGAAGQPGFWNSFPPSLTPQPLADLNAQPTAVTLLTTNSSSVNLFPSVIPPGGDQALMEDFQWSGGLGEVVTFRFEGLAPGAYELTTYGSNPGGGSDMTEVTVLGSNDPPQVLVGGWPGAQALGWTFARHAVSTANGVVEVRLAGLGAFPADRTVCNGLQLVPAGGVGTSYCGPAVPNSTGSPASLEAFGSAVAADNNLSLVASNLPANQFGYFLAGQTQAFLVHPGGSQGVLCLANPIARYSAQVQSSGAAGVLNLQVDLTAIPFSPPVAAAAGQTWNFQAWYRDANPGPTSNFSDGRSVLLQ